LHIRAELLAEATSSKTVNVLIKNCPEGTPGGAVTLYFTKNNSRAEYVSD
jgi:hypothetical protein